MSDVASLFNLTSSSGNGADVLNFIICVVVSLILGLALAMCARYRSSYSKSFLITLALLPAIVTVVIMAVNGNIGAGVAVAGAFSLIRFRSAPGDAKQIMLVFASMCIGLVSGMQYLGYAILFTIIICIMNFIYGRTNIRNQKVQAQSRILNITVPENLNFDSVFDETLQKYTDSYDLLNVKTTQMGTLYKLKYKVSVKDTSRIKEFMDELRCLNGNLEVSVMQETLKEEL